MKKIVFILLLLALPILGAAQTKVRPELGVILSKKEIPKKPPEMAVRCCFSPFIEKKHDGVKYTVAFNGETREIIYLATYNRNFKTADDYKIGDFIGVSFEQTSQSGGTIYGEETTDGWYPVIGYTFRLPNIDGEIQNLNPFEDAKENQVISVQILAFAKGMWGNPQE